MKQSAGSIDLRELAVVFDYETGLIEYCQRIGASIDHCAQHGNLTGCDPDFIGKPFDLAVQATMELRCEWLRHRSTPTGTAPRASRGSMNCAAYKRLD